MSWAAFVTQFASPGNGRTCPRMHLCWGIRVPPLARLSSAEEQ